MNTDPACVVWIELADGTPWGLYIAANDREALLYAEGWGEHGIASIYPPPAPLPDIY